MAQEIKHLLLADDNDANRLISKTILERGGFTITTAVNGSHALHLAEQQCFHLIVMDIMMPVMDGVRALRKLRREPGINQSTPVFALTAYSTIQDQKRYMLAGFDGVLSKPLRPGDIECALDRLTKNRVVSFTKTSPTQGDENAPILDKDMIQQLSEVADPTTLLSIQDRFWTSIQQQCELMNRTLPEALRGTTKQLSEFRHAVHAIKGASASIGLSQVAQISRALQNAPPPDIPGLVETLLNSIERSRPELSAALSGSRQFDSTMQMGREDQSKSAHNG